MQLGLTMTDDLAPRVSALITALDLFHSLSRRRVAPCAHLVWRMLGRWVWRPDAIREWRARCPNISGGKQHVLVLLVGGLLASLGVGTSAAQQVLVDDPTSVPTGAAQLEAWHSTEGSTMSPAVRVLPLVEVAGGVVFVPSGADQRTVEYGVESKILLRPGSAHRVGAALVGGAGFRRVGVPRGRPGTVFGYGILSQEVVPGRLTAYQNVGWMHTEAGPHQLTWGARIDWAFWNRFTLIGEVAGEGRTDPALQAALRTELLAERIEMDVSVTRAGPFDDRTTWGTVGLTFMSAPLY